MKAVFVVIVLWMLVLGMIFAAAFFEPGKKEKQQNHKHK